MKRLAFFLAAGCSSTPAAMDAAIDSPSTTDASDASNDAPGDVASDAPPALSCADYCDAVGMACLNADQQYFSSDVCLAQCALFPKGTFGDSTGSLGCRQYHGGAPATSDPAMHCRHAGPTGGGVCGSRCEAFCLLTAGVCIAANKGAVNPFASTQDCMTACGAMKVVATGPELDATGTNTLECRFYELELAWSDVAGGSAKNHCPNLSSPSPTCTK